MSRRALLLTVALLASLPNPGVVAQHREEWRTDFARHTVPLEEIVSGGPPKDGIPPIDAPRFLSVREADAWLSPREPVVVLDLAGEVKAYPLQVLIWHEIVNDVVGGVPVAVTYCPLCNTALAFDRRLDGVVLDFGTTGRLRHSDLVMYDRQTESWWQQASGEGIVGRHAGRRLAFLSAPLVSWGTFRAAHPTARVLSRETGHDRPYGETPYIRYDGEGRSPIPQFFRPRPDGRLPAMERVVAVPAGSVAYAFGLLGERGVINDTAGGIPITVFWAPGTASAVDRRRIAEGRDVGSTGVLDRRLDGQLLTFEGAGPGRFRDRETGTRWDILGRGLDGPLAGRHLTPLPHGNHFWFAWAVFQPDTRLWR